jgi:hypothetical protein
MAEKLNLNKIKEELSARKSERTAVSTQLGENFGKTIVPRDVFLTELMRSFETGKETVATEQMKIIENKTAARLGESQKFQNIQPVQQIQQQPQRLNETMFQEQERDELMFQKLQEKRNKQGLVETMQEYNQQKPNQQQYIPQQQPLMPNLNNNVINEEYLAGSVKKMVGNFITENYHTLIEQEIKNAIVDIYVGEKILNVLKENESFIEKIFVETLKKFKAKNPVKA